MGGRRSLAHATRCSRHDATSPDQKAEGPRMILNGCRGANQPRARGADPGRDSYQMGNDRPPARQRRPVVTWTTKLHTSKDH